MKIKRSIAKKIFRTIFYGLESVDNNVKKMKNTLKKGVNKINKFFTKKTIKEFNKQVEKIDRDKQIKIYSKEELQFYLLYDGKLTEISYDFLLNIMSKETKELRNKIKESNQKDILIDEYSNGKKFIIDRMIKSVYFKAKNLIITINGILLRINNEYRHCIDKFLNIRNLIKEKSYKIVSENKFLLKFIVDNNIDSDEEFDNCLDILTKMYISEKDEQLYNELIKFNNLALR